MSQKTKTSNINYLTKENELNRLIRDQKLSGKKEYILFTSLWDSVSCNLVVELEKLDTSKSINVVNSFDTPHSFVIWGVTNVPTLVIIDRKGSEKRTTITNHVTDIYKRLGLER